MPFQIDKSGRILLEAQVNDTSGLFLFDTGAGITTMNVIITGDSILQFDHTLTDAIGLQQTKKLRAIDHFQVGEVQVDQLIFWPEDSGSHLQKGEKNLLGVIGNNFLTHFVWDFDLRNNQVTIAKSINDLADVEKGTDLPLKNIDGKWKIPVTIDGTDREIELDFGFNGSITLNDSIKKDKNTLYGTDFGKKRTLFSHTLSGPEVVDTSFFVVAQSIKLGNQEFTDIKYFEKKYAELIGIQFMWAFERVILDYPNQEVILCKKDQSHQFAVKEHSIDNFLTMLINHNDGYYVSSGNPYLVHESKMITTQNDTVKAEYYIYGKAKYWGKDVNSLDSIEILQSVRLPNGDSINAPYTINVSEKYFVDP